MSLKWLLRQVKSEEGQGLVETLLAASVSIIVVTALVALWVFALRNSRQSTYIAQATQIAQAQLEYARSYRDSNTWSQFLTAFYNNNTSTCLTASHCYFDMLTSGLFTTGAAGTNVSPFTYYIISSCPSPSPATCSDTSYNDDVIRITAIVSWSLGGKTERVYNTTDFTNWRGR